MRYLAIILMLFAITQPAKATSGEAWVGQEKASIVDSYTVLDDWMGKPAFQTRYFSVKLTDEQKAQLAAIKAVDEADFDKITGGTMPVLQTLVFFEDGATECSDKTLVGYTAMYQKNNSFDFNVKKKELLNWAMGTKKGSPLSDFGFTELKCSFENSGQVKFSLSGDYLAERENFAELLPDGVDMLFFKWNVAVDDKLFASDEVKKSLAEKGKKDEQSAQPEAESAPAAVAPAPVPVQESSAPGIISGTMTANGITTNALDYIAKRIVKKKHSNFIEVQIFNAKLTDEQKNKLLTAEDVYRTSRQEDLVGHYPIMMVEIEMKKDATACDMQNFKDISISTTGSKGFNYNKQFYPFYSWTNKNAEVKCSFETPENLSLKIKDKHMTEPFPEGDTKPGFTIEWDITIDAAN